MDDLFKIRNLNVFYSKTHALNDINCDIKKNQITALIGPSGCGKSTFLRCLNRMNDLVAGFKFTGTIKIDDKDIVRDIDVLDLRRKVGMVFQKANPFCMSIYDNVAYGPRLHSKLSKTQLDEIVEESLRASNLFEEVKDRLHSSALGLSGGQQQRLCIARSLAIKPECLLLDEPTSALDPISTAHIESLLLKLKENYTIVIVTHNMQQASRISDRTCFFCINEEKEGYLVEEGETKKIFFTPENKKTEDYISGRFG